MYVIGTLSVAVAAIPILIVVWKVLRAPLRTWIPMLLLIALIFLAQGVSALLGEDGMFALIYLLAGAAR